MSEFFNYEVDGETKSACLALVRRHGPRLLREGGGHLPGECLGSGRRLEWKKRVRVLRLERMGWSYKRIALDVGCTDSAVSKIVTKAGRQRKPGRKTA